MKPQIFPVCRLRAQCGVTMIEVLVAILIFAIGLLGVAGMQTLALKSTNNSNTRTLVTMHAYEIAERIRANMPAAEAGDYDGIKTSTAKASTPTDCRPNCTPSGLAALDAKEWVTNLEADVPTATAQVAYANGEAQITINWTERSLGNDAEAQSYTLRARIDQ